MLVIDGCDISKVKENLVYVFFVNSVHDSKYHKISLYLSIYIYFL